MYQHRNWRPVIVLAVGFFSLISTVLIGRVGAGSRKVTVPVRGQQKKRIGEVPSKAKVQNLLAPQDTSQQIRMMLSFQVNDEAGLEQLISDLNDPGSPMYHQWLTPEEFGQRFGRSEAEFNEALSWLQSQGFDVDRPYPSRMSIGFTGTVEAVQRAFNVQMGLYWDSNENRSFYSNTNAPTLPPEIDAITVGLDGLNNAVLYRHPARHRDLVPLTKSQVRGQSTGHGIQPDL